MPGFLMGMHEGHVVGMIGNREDSISPDTLLTITSDTPLNDGTWHHVAFARDRHTRTITLRVDGVGMQPVPDPITFPLFNDRPLTLARWENDFNPAYFFGDLDEIKVSVQGRPAAAGADTLLCLRFDEGSSEPIDDASQYGNPVVDNGTSVVEGFQGSARTFDGLQSFLVVQDGVSGVFDFDASTSFTVDCMFKTSEPGYQIMLRKGLAPVPGFALEMIDGHVRGLIGNREDGVPPDTVLDIARPADIQRWAVASCYAGPRRTGGRENSFCMWTRNPHASPWKTFSPRLSSAKSVI